MKYITINEENYTTVIFIKHIEAISYSSKHKISTIHTTNSENGFETKLSVQEIKNLIINSSDLLKELDF